MIEAVRRAQEAIEWIEAHELQLEGIDVIIGQASKDNTSVALFPKDQEAIERARSLTTFAPKAPVPERDYRLEGASVTETLEINLFLPAKLTSA